MFIYRATTYFNYVFMFFFSLFQLILNDILLFLAIEKRTEEKMEKTNEMW